MSSRFYHILSYIFFLLLGLVLLYFAFKGQDIQDIIFRLSKAKTIWVIPVLMAALLSYLVRSLRWHMLIRASGYKASFTNTYHTLMFGYLVNLAIPRLGEISRCAALNKKENIPFNVLFGTVVTERVIDVVMLLILVGGTFLLEFRFLMGFMNTHILQPFYREYFSGGGAVNWLMLLLGLFIIAGIAAGLLLVQRRLLPGNPLIKKFFSQMRIGLLSIMRVKPVGLFLLYTGIIWLMYYLTTYLLFFSLEATEELGLIPGLVINMLSNIARTVPIQGGGLGAYHFLVTQGLILYDISPMNGNTFATLNHGIQTLYPLVFGALSWVVLFFTKKRRSNG